MTSSFVNRLPHLVALAVELNRLDLATAATWDAVPVVMRSLIKESEEVASDLADDLGRLSDDEFWLIVTGSSEVTTHYAWRLVDSERQYSIWLNEYKPDRDWLPGYANVVHNHRYSFCSAVLRGGYTEQIFDVDLEPGGDAVVGVRAVSEIDRLPGSVRSVPASQFHRIPCAVDGTVSLLVKSRPSRGFSTSFDPATGIARRHVPIESRRRLLIDQLTGQVLT